MKYIEKKEEGLYTHNKLNLNGGKMYGKHFYEIPGRKGKSAYVKL